jgi:hypothetical protein
MTDPRFCPNLAYAPKTPPHFPGDLQHDLRNHLLSLRLETIAQWEGEANRLYLRVADILRRRKIDPLAITLDMDDRLDARTLMVAHAHMAAFWRATCLPEVMQTAGKRRWGPQGLYNHLNSYGDLTAIFRSWLMMQTNHWADHRPDVLELMLLAVVGDHTRSGIAVEAEFFYTLAWDFPVPGVKTPMPLRTMPAR